MNKFAKLFDVEDGQVLFMLTSNDNGPLVFIETKFYGVELTTSMCFENLDKELAWKNAEEFFRKVNQNVAKEFYVDMRTKIFGYMH